MRELIIEKIRHYVIKLTLCLCLLSGLLYTIVISDNKLVMFFSHTNKKSTLSLTLLHIV